jgi:hypothetical protein
MKFNKIISILVLSVYLITWTKGDTRGFVLLEGGASTYKINNDGIRSSISLDVIVRNAEIEFCQIFDCGRERPNLLKIERCENDENWFLVSLTMTFPVGDFSGFNSKPMVKKSAVIPVRKDGQVGVLQKVSQVLDQSAGSRFVNWLRK